MRTIRVGTRNSELAVTQTGHVVRHLEEICAREHLDYRSELVKIVTRGDRILDVTLSKVGGKGLFVKEIEEALLEDRIDFAVHSMKDMPSESRAGLVAAAISKREDPRDCLVSKEGKALDELPQGARVGTSSLRRACQLLNERPDLQIGFVRGNIGTRIGKLESEGFDAIILAAAGLNRMQWGDRISQLLEVDRMLPAAGQGALGIECRENDAEVRALLARFNDPATARTVAAERSFLLSLNGGCQVPIGAYATVETGDEQGDGVVTLTGMVGTPDGKTLLKETGSGNDPHLLGKEIAERLAKRGARDILEELILAAQQDEANKGS